VANTILNIVGFESGDFTTWTPVVECIADSGGGFLFDTTNKRGAYALKIAPSGLSKYIALAGVSAAGIPANMTASTLFASFYLYVNTRPTSATTEEVARIVSGSSTLKLGLRMDATGKLALYDSTNTKIGSSGTTVLATGTWYRIDLKATNGTSGAYELRINEVAELSGTANLAATNCSRLILGSFPAGGSDTTASYTYDDVWLDSSAYAPHGYTIVNVPITSGAAQQWSAGTSPSDYTKVNITPWPDDSYVQTNGTAGASAVYGVSNATLPALATILCVRAYAFVSDGGAGVTNTFQFGARSSGTDSLTSTRNTAAGIDPAEDLYKLLPTDPATGAAWTKAGVEAAQVKIVEGTASVTTRVYAAGFHVAYVPPTTVTGAQAAETETPHAGTAKIATAGAHASEVDTAHAGVPKAIVAGHLASENDTAHAGALHVVHLGMQSGESESAHSGTAIVVVAGQFAIEQDDANPGTAHVLTAGTAGNEVDSAHGGLPLVALPGAQALEIETASAGVGVIVPPGVVLGGNALERDDPHSGQAFVVVAGGRIVETDDARSGALHVVAAGAQASENDTAHVGRIVGPGHLPLGCVIGYEAVIGIGHIYRATQEWSAQLASPWAALISEPPWSVELASPWHARVKESA
jgi:hypothetical protein